MNRIVVTGMGVISAIGNNVAENRSSLIAGKCGMSKLEMFATRYADLIPVGEVKISSDALKQMLGVEEPNITRTTLLALHAINEAIADSKLSRNEISSEDTALVSANTVGGMCLTDKMFEDSRNESAGSSYIAEYDYVAVNLYLQKRLQLTGQIHTINTACSSSANAIMFGARLIRSGRANRVIVGGVDSLSKFTINGFNALHILSAENCRPFDINRKGLNLGEGAAFLVLEKEQDATGKKIYGCLSGYANGNDAYHASSLSENGNGPYKVMKDALLAAGLDPGQIDFINAHGTATENNDVVESTAMIRLFGTPPAFASTKGNVGHTLGAAGAVEALYCLLNLSEQELYPSMNFSTPIGSTGLVPVRSYQKRELNHIMSNSFGFGGNCSSLIFSKA